MAKAYSLMASRWATDTDSKQKEGEQPQANSKSTSLDATRPPFVLSTSTELQPYAPKPPSGDAEQWEQWVVHQQNETLARMQEWTFQNSYCIGKLVHDVQTLERQIRDMSEDTGDDGDNQTSSTIVAGQHDATNDAVKPAPEPSEKNVVPFPNYEDNCEIRLPDEFYEVHSKEDIAQVYCEEAERAERCAKRLRAQAAETMGNVETPAKTEKVAAPVREYMCCHAAFETVAELKAHVGAEHGGATTATPMAPPTADTQQSLEIKPSQSPITNSTYIPSAIAKLPPFKSPIPASHNKTFPLNFLQHTLRGTLWSDGFYYISENSILPSSSYWILNGTSEDGGHEPFLPKNPGEHGAKLTVFFRDADNGPTPENYKNVPVFIHTSRDPKGEYRYFGSYSQPRFSDRVDYDHQHSIVPSKVLEYWSRELSAVGLAEWMMEQLIEHFWPRPSPPSSMSQQDLESYKSELAGWKEYTAAHLGDLTSAKIRSAFQAADLASNPPGLRLWWEYFECVNYDQGFYSMLESMVENPLVNPFLGRSAANGDKSGGLQDDDDEDEPGALVRHADLKVNAAKSESSDESQYSIGASCWADDKFVATAGAKAEEKSKGATATKPEPKSQPSKPAVNSATSSTKPSPPAEEPPKNSWAGYGDMAAAKQFSAQVVNKSGPRGGRPDQKRFVPPHLRSKFV